MNAQIRYTSGGDIYLDPPQHGRPSSVSCTVHTPSGATHVSPAPTPTTDPVDTTLDGAAAIGATSLTLTDANGVEVGRYYDVIAADKNAERVRVIAISGLVVTLQDGLGRAYADGAVFAGNRITVTIAAGDATPRAEGYEVRWEYTIDSKTHYAVQLFDIVTSPWPEVILRPHEFRQYAPGVSGPHHESSYASGIDFTDDIATATERVRIECLTRGTRPDLFRSFDAFKRPVAMAIVTLWAEDGVNIPSAYVDIPEQWLESRREIYSAAMGDALQATRSYDANDDGVVTDGERKKRLDVMRWRL